MLEGGLRSDLAGGAPFVVWEGVRFCCCAAGADLWARPSVVSPFALLTEVLFCTPLAWVAAWVDIWLVGGSLFCGVAGTAPSLRGPLHLVSAMTLHPFVRKGPHAFWSP